MERSINRDCLLEIMRARLRLIEYAETHSLSELLQETLDSICLLSDSPIGFYHFVSEDQKTIMLQQWSSKTKSDYCHTTGQAMHYPLEMAGVWADCVRESRPMIHNDYESLPNKKGMPKGHAKLIRELVVPVMRQHRVVAILGVGNKAELYTEDDQVIVQLMAEDTWELVEKKRSQEEKSQVEQQYSQLFHEMEDGYAVHEIICDSQGKPVDYRFLNINPAFQRITGLDRSIIGKRVTEILPGTEIEWIEKYGKVALEGETLRFENYAAALDKHFLVTAFCPGPGKFITLFMDITQRMKAEKRLKDSEDRFRSLFENMSAGVAVYEPVKDGEDFLFRDLNQAGQKFSQLKKEDVLGKSLRDTIPFLEDLGLMDAFRACLKTGEPQVFPVKRYHNSYLEEWVENHIFLLPSGLLVSIYENRTEQHLLEERLRQSEKMEAIGKLAGGIAHDFNNILGAIMGYSELSIEQLPDDSPLARNITQIIQASERAHRLVNQILTFSRQKEGGERKAISLEGIVNEAYEMLQAALPSTVKLELCIGEHQHYIMGDETHIHEILMNLCTNGSHAMGDKGTLRIEYYEVEMDQTWAGVVGSSLPGTYAVLEVQDQGTGMDGATQRHIFDPFYTTKEVGKGTGMGLSVIYGIMKSYNGNIRISSEKSKGTTISVYFPVYMGAINVEQILEEDESDSIMPAGRENILLVDDDEDLAMVLHLMLESLGYTVQRYYHGMDALMHFKEYAEEIDLVITDYLMPELTGEDLAKELWEIRSDLPILLCSGHGPALEKSEIHPVKQLRIMKKPIRKKDLAQTIRSMIDEAK